MRYTFTNGALAAIAALSLAAAMPAASAAEDHSQHMQQGQSDKAPGKLRIKLADTILTDQNGNTVKFKTEVLADRLAVINFIYTTCTTVCPVQSALIADLQQRLGERSGRDVSLISISVDPLRDTPLRLKAYAARYKAGPGWSFLTGSRQAVDKVLKAFDVYTPNFADHPAAMLVGNPRTGEWVRFLGFPSSDQLLGRIKELQAGGARSARAN